MTRTGPTRRARLDAPGREPGVDLARGLAVIGMFAAHVLQIDGSFAWHDPSTWIAAVNGNSSILFATLAGVSLALTTSGAPQRAAAALSVARWRIAVRAIALYAIGVALVELPAPVYVILPAYGILFLLAIPMLRMRAGGLFALAGALAVATPLAFHALPDIGGAWEDYVGWHYPFLVWATFIAAGLAVGRMSRDAGSLAALGLVAAGLSIVGFAAGGASSNPALQTAPHSSGLGEVVGSGSLAIAIIVVAILVCRTPVRWLLWPIRAVGSLALTAYVGQLLAWSVWYWIRTSDGSHVSALSGFREADPFWPLTLGTVAFCTFWALFVGRGPLEWAIQALARAIVPSKPGA